MMRAKLLVYSVTTYGDPVTSENISMGAVTTKAFDAEGNSEDNTYARYTPSASLNITINNPALLGRIKQDQKFYVDFTEAPE